MVRRPSGCTAGPPPSGTRLWRSPLRPASSRSRRAAPPRRAPPRPAPPRLCRPSRAGRPRRPMRSAPAHGGPAARPRVGVGRLGLTLAAVAAAAAAATAAFKKMVLVEEKRSVKDRSTHLLLHLLDLLHVGVKERVPFHHAAGLVLSAAEPIGEHLLVLRVGQVHLVPLAVVDHGVDRTLRTLLTACRQNCATAKKRGDNSCYRRAPRRSCLVHLFQTGEEVLGLRTYIVLPHVRCIARSLPATDRIWHQNY